MMGCLSHLASRPRTAKLSSLRYSLFSTTTITNKETPRNPQSFFFSPLKQYGSVLVSLPALPRADGIQGLAHVGPERNRRPHLAGPDAGPVADVGAGLVRPPALSRAQPVAVADVGARLGRPRVSLLHDGGAGGAVMQQG